MSGQASLRTPPDLPLRIPMQFEANLGQAELWRLIRDCGRVDGAAFLHDMDINFNTPQTRFVEEDGCYIVVMAFAYRRDPNEWFLEQTGLPRVWPEAFDGEQAGRIWREMWESLDIRGRSMPPAPASLLERKGGPHVSHFFNARESLAPEQMDYTRGELRWKTDFMAFNSTMKRALDQNRKAQQSRHARPDGLDRLEAMDRYAERFDHLEDGDLRDYLIEARDMARDMSQRGVKDGDSQALRKLMQLFPQFVRRLDEVERSLDSYEYLDKAGQIKPLIDFSPLIDKAIDLYEDMTDWYGDVSAEARRKIATPMDDLSAGDKLRYLFPKFIRKLNYVNDALANDEYLDHPTSRMMTDEEALIEFRRALARALGIGLAPVVIAGGAAAISVPAIAMIASGMALDLKLYAETVTVGTVISNAYTTATTQQIVLFLEGLMQSQAGDVSLPNAYGYALSISVFTSEEVFRYDITPLHD